jgi:hypothetical protein
MVVELTFFKVLFMAPVTPLLQCPPNPIKLTMKTESIFMLKGTATLPSRSDVLLDVSLSTSCSSARELSATLTFESSIITNLDYERVCLES